MSVTEHKREAPDSVRCMVLTISDTRSKDTDKSGKLIIERLERVSHCVVEYRIERDEIDMIVGSLKHGIDHKDIDVVIVNGGTGIAPRDVTIEAVRSLLDKEIPGFGELFRMLSYTEDIGSSAILSRAVAGVSRNTVVFSVPGSSGAVRLAMDRLILPEVNHIVHEIKKDR